MLTPLKPKNAATISANGLKFYYETFGDPKNPPVLLIMGLSAPALQWFPYFIDPIVHQGYYVIRFDNRDIGLSSWIDPSDWQKAPYSLEALAQDAIAILDALKINQAHVIGASMGGAIAQRLAISHPSRVLSLTSLISFGDVSALTSGGINFPTSGKVPSLIEYLAFWASLTGSAFPFDKTLFSELYQEHIVIRKGYNPNGSEHQLKAIAISGSRMSALGQIKIPTLIAHGTEDPLISFGHAADYAKQIAHCRFFPLQGIGHEVPEGICQDLHPEIFNLFISS